MRRLLLGTVLGTAFVLLASTAALAPPQEFEGGQKGGEAFNMTVVGQHDLGGRGFNADVWFHEEFAYVGRWGFTDWALGSKQRFCPDDENRGIAVVDVSDPANPEMVGTLEQPEGTSVEDVVVYEAPFGPLAGHDIAAGGIQVCGGSRYDTSFERGLMLWDVTDPENPVELGFENTGCCTRGVHEFEVQHRTDLGRTFAYATVPASEYEDPNTSSGFRDEAGRGDFRLIDITDPNSPDEISDWGVIHDAGGPLGSGQGCDPDPVFGHGAEPSADGKTVFLAYWDSGFVALDLTDPENPSLIGDTDYAPDEDGDGHSSQFDEERELLFTADEDFCLNSGPDIERGLGYLRVYDFEDPQNPVQIGEYRTPNSMTGGPPGSGDYTIHNNFYVADEERTYTSWYSDGVRVIDVSDPTDPEEIAFFVPPASQNPVKPSQRGVLSQTPQVWGVVVDEAGDGLIYASDMNSGLWILEVDV
jgi:hypothetical protein